MSPWPKQESLGYISVNLLNNKGPKATCKSHHTICIKSCRQFGSIALANITWLALKPTAFAKKTPQNGHNAVQGHSRSLILVPIKSLYASSYISESYKLTLYFAPFSRYRKLSTRRTGAGRSTHAIIRIEAAVLRHASINGSYSAVCWAVVHSCYHYLHHRSAHVHGTITHFHLHIYPRTEWTVSAFAFTANVGPHHLPTPEGRKAELGSGIKTPSFIFQQIQWLV